MTRGRKLLGTLFGAVLSVAAVADEASIPDEAFLEFLGTWDTSDDEWQEFFDSLPDEVPDPVGRDSPSERKAADVAE